MCFLTILWPYIANNVLTLHRKNFKTKRMKKFFNKNVKIALTIIVSLCLLYWGIEFLKGVNLFKPANFYYAKFDKVDGLIEATPITVNGFQVGQVREIKYDYEKNKIMVMMSMNGDLKIPVGSNVAIQSGLIGSAQMVLTLGDNEACYKVGDEIPTIVPRGIMDKVTTEVLPSVGQIMPRVDSIMTSVNGLVGDPALVAAVARLDGITAELARSSQQLTQLLTSVNRSVPGVMNNVNGITSNLTATSSNLNQFSGTLNALPLDSTMAQVNATIANLNALSRQLNNPNSSLGMLINDKQLYTNATNAVATLDSLLADIKKNPKRYINVKVF